MHVDSDAHCPQLEKKKKFTQITCADSLPGLFKGNPSSFGLRRKVSSRQRFAIRLAPLGYENISFIRLAKLILQIPLVDGYENISFIRLANLILQIPFIFYFVVPWWTFRTFQMPSVDLVAPLWTFGPCGQRYPHPLKHEIGGEPVTPGIPFVVPFSLL